MEALPVVSCPQLAHRVGFFSLESDLAFDSVDGFVDRLSRPVHRRRRRHRRRRDVVPFGVVHHQFVGDVVVAKGNDVTVGKLSSDVSQRRRRRRRRHLFRGLLVV